MANVGHDQRARAVRGLGCLVGPMRRIATVLLCLGLILVGCEYSPTSASANPLVLGVGLTGAALAAIAVGYAVSPTFQDTCDSMGATIAEGTMLQTMLDYAVYACLPASDRVLAQPYLDDGRLLKAVIAHYQRTGDWGVVEQQAGAAVTSGGNVYFQISPLWANFGFGEHNVAMTANADGWISGSLSLSAIPESHIGWPPGPSEQLLSAAQGYDILMVAEGLVENPGYWIKTRRETIYSPGGSMWVWQPWQSPSADSDLKCMLCGDIGEGYAATLQIQWFNLWEDPPGGGGSWGAPTVTAYGPASGGAYDWMLHHGGAKCQPLDLSELLADRGTVFPSGVTYPSNTYIPSDTYTALPGATTFPSYPERATIPPYVPPAANTWPGAQGGPIEADTGLEGIADGLENAADTIGTVGADWPAGFSHIANWLTSPMSWFLDGWAALLRWLAKFWVNLLNWLASVFTVNADYIAVELSPQWNTILARAQLSWPFAIVPVISLVINSFEPNGDAFGLVYDYQIAGRSYELDLRPILVRAGQFRWLLVALVWAFAALTILGMLKPSVSV